MATKNYQSITIYKDMAPQILELEKEEAGEIFQAIFKYSCYGEDTDMGEQDRFVRSLWKTIKLKLQAGEEHREHISEIRAEAGRKGGKAKANNSQDDQAKDNISTTYTDYNSRTNSLTGTISSTVTDTDKEQTDTFFDSEAQSASAAANAEPPACNLFSVKQLSGIVEKNKINLESDGIEEFYKEMQQSGWVLYQQLVTKKGIIKALRGYAKYHPEYSKPEKNEVIKDPGDKDEDNSVDTIEHEIYKIAHNYISQQLFDKNVGGHHCLIRNYCPKEAFTNDQLSYMQNEWSIWLKSKRYVLEDSHM